MKRILALAFYSIILSSFSFGDVGAARVVGNPERGSAGVDETYVDEIKNKESAILRQERNKEKLKENPANESSAKNYGHLYSKEDDQQLQEERKAVEKQEARKGEAGGEKTEGTVWELEKKDRE